MILLLVRIFYLLEVFFVTCRETFVMELYETLNRFSSVFYSI